MLLDASPDWLQALYLASYGRPADPDGMIYLSKELRLAHRHNRFFSAFAKDPDFQQCVRKLGPNAFLNHARRNLLGYHHAQSWPTSPVSDALNKKELLEQVLLLWRQASQLPSPVMLGRIQLAHRLTWRIGAGHYIYDVHVANKLVDHFNEPAPSTDERSTADAIMTDLHQHGLLRQQSRSREFVRQLTSSLPSEITAPLLPRRANRTLILHIGSEKTGSSTIQSFLAANSRRLERDGILYQSSSGRVEYRDLVIPPGSS